MDNKYHYALGRRKASSATVRIFESTGNSTVNGKPLEDVYPSEIVRKQLLAPFTVADLDPKSFHFTAKAKGGGTMGQMGAIRLALSRALVKMNSENKKPLKQEGFMTRDSRVVERKKPGLRKARKAEQFSKR